MHKYYKNEIGKLFFDPIVSNYVNLTEISKSQFNDILNSTTVAECRKSALSNVRFKCQESINSGFNSATLGYQCQYRNTRDQQMTMRDAAAIGGKIWRDESFTVHTKSQASAVLAKSRSEVERHRTKYADKCVYINDDERTADEINAVTWDSSE